MFSPCAACVACVALLLSHCRSAASWRWSWWWTRGSAPQLFELLVAENPNFCEDFLRQPAMSFGGAVILSRFHHGNILVAGDAAHAMVSTKPLIEMAGLGSHCLDNTRTTFCNVLCFKKCEWCLLCLIQPVWECGVTSAHIVFSPFSFHHMARGATPHLKTVYFLTKFLKNPFMVYLLRNLLHDLVVSV